MKRTASYHVHTNFCDGNNEPEEMLKAAIDAGMTDIGFSAHAAWPVATEWHMSVPRYADYAAEITRLQTAYQGKITVKLGFEADWIAGVTAPDSAYYGRFNPDYLIGSVHFVPTDVKGRLAPFWAVDAAAPDVRAGIDRCFDGDGKRAVEAYYAAIRDMVSSCDFDIVGHLDLPRKRNGELAFFDETASWYRRELKATVKAIAKAGKIVELNTGAIARKAMDDIYPSDELLSLLRKAGIPVTLASDAHSPADLACAYDRAREAARRSGYDSFMYLNDDGWSEQAF